CARSYYSGSSSFVYW
nr:immunoglobulin heavy chain junction region [Mus musculus]